MVSIATDGSPDEFAAFIDEYGLDGVRQSSDLERPALVASMLSEFRITGVPAMVAIRPDGDYIRFSTWGQQDQATVVNYLDS